MGQQKQYDPDEIETDLIYPSDRNIDSIDQQVMRLKEHFPHLTTSISDKNTEKVLSEGSEGLIVVPKVHCIADSYIAALVKVLEVLERARPSFLNARKYELSSEYIKLQPKTAEALSVKAGETSGDLMLLPVQLGRKYLGKSARKVESQLAKNEFGLGPFEIGIYLLTHPNWLSSNDDLGIDSIGVRYAPFQHGFFTYILFFYFHHFLRFQERWIGCPDRRFGPATGFV